MYSALEVSKYIVTKCTNDKKPISNLQLQKILYYVQKEYLMRGSVAFSDEIEAWQFGPVVPSVYYRFCVFGAMPITNTYDDININAEDMEIINPIVDEKRKLDPWEMVEETHKSGGAWDQTYRSGEGNRDVISRELIKKAG